MTMTQHHFQFIAETIRDITDWDERTRTAELFANALAATNRAFDRDRFIDVALGRRTR